MTRKQRAGFCGLRQAGRAWVSSLFGSRKPRASQTQSGPRGFRPGLEHLESRQLLSVAPLLLELEEPSGLVAPSAASTLDAVFTVNSFLDTVDVNPGDGFARDASGLTSLRATVMEANALSGTETINLPAGTYQLTLDGMNEDGAATGDLDIKGQLSIIGAGASQTIIDATGLNDRVFDMKSGWTTRLQDLTIMGGRISDSTAPADCGGGIRVESSANVTLSGCLLKENLAPRKSDVYPNSPLGSGGAIYSSGVLTILDSRFEGNSASNMGGAICVGGVGATAVIRNTSFSGNRAFQGGAVENDGSMSIESSTFSDNRVSENGSGGALRNLGNLTLTNSTVSHNSAGDGGGIANSGTLTVLNSTITGNLIGGGGGAGLKNSGTASLENTIVAGNLAYVDYESSVYGTITSLGHNLIGNTAGSTGFGATGDLLNVGAKLGPLADNGGPTKTHAVLPGSPAIDAASSATAPATDQRGVARPQGIAPDIGAFEQTEGEIRGVVWNDLDGDGSWDTGDSGLANRQIYVDQNTNGKYDVGELTAITAADGSYAIAGLPSGTYVVAEVPQANWQPTYPGSVGPAALFGIQPNTNTLVQLDPVTGAVVRSFPLPVATGSQYAGLSGADDGQSLIFQNGGTQLYRIDPNTGQVLSVETMAWAGSVRSGLSFESGSIFAFNGGLAVQRQDGYGGAVSDFITNVQGGSPGAMGGDDYGRHFVFAQGAILEFDPQTPNTILNRLPAPAMNLAGLAFDGFRLYASTMAGDLFTLDPNTGAVLKQTTAQGGYLTGLGIANLTLPQRLFAVPHDGTGKIAELDPATGQELRRFAAPEPINDFDTGLAFDGRHLFFINGSGSDTLWELDPQTGAVLDSDPITAGSGAYDGLAALNGKIYLLDHAADDLLEFDPLTDTITRVLDINAINPGTDLVGGLAGIGSPNALLATVEGSTLVEIDPSSGRIARVFTPSTQPPCFGVAAVDGLIYVGHGQSNQMDVYSRDGTLVGQRTLTYSVGSFGGDSLGGGIRTQRVNVASGEVVEGIDFGNQSSLSEIRGVKWNDLDGDGVRDAEEPALAGWQIYVDRNANGKYDVGEPTATTADDGSYAISGLPSGAYIVAEVPQANWQPTYPGTIGPAALFGIQPNTNQLVQLDPVTGAVVRSFPLPVTANSQCEGLSGADDGQTLIFQTGNSTELYRIDPNTGRVLSVETMPASQSYRGGLSFESGTTSSIFANNSSTSVQRQDGYGGSVSDFVAAVHPRGPGAMGGDDYGRHFVFADGQIIEFDPQTPNTILKRLPSPATTVAGLAFDGFRLYASTTDGYLFTLDPNTGAVLNRTFAQSGYLAGLGVANLAAPQRLFAIPSGGGGWIVEIDPSSGQELRSIPAPESWGMGLAFDGGICSASTEAARTRSGSWIRRPGRSLTATESSLAAGITTVWPR